MTNFTTITHDNAVAMLSNAIPEFNDDTWDRFDWGDPGLSLPLYELFACAYIPRLMETGQEPELLVRCLAFLEQLVESDDPEVREMVMDCFVDGLGVDTLLSVEDRLGPSTKLLLETYRESSAEYWRSRGYQV